MALIHRWPLTANGNNVVGGKDFSMVGTVPFTSKAECTGKVNYLEVSLDALPNVCTLSCWVQRTVAISYDIVPIHIATGGTGNGSGAGISQMYVTSGTGAWSYAINNVTTTDGYLPTGNFHLWLWQFTGERWNLFINGTERVSTALSAPAWGNRTVVVGGKQDVFTPDESRTYHLDARIYDHALSQTEIDVLVASGPNGDPRVTGLPLSRPPLPAVLSCLPASLSRGFR